MVDHKHQRIALQTQFVVHRAQYLQLAAAEYSAQSTLKIAAQSRKLRVTLPSLHQLLCRGLYGGLGGHGALCGHNAVKQQGIGGFEYPLVGDIEPV